LANELIVVILGCGRAGTVLGTASSGGAGNMYEMVVGLLILLAPRSFEMFDW